MAKTNSKQIDGKLISESLLDYNNLAAKLNDKATITEAVENLLKEQISSVVSQMLNEAEDDNKEYEEEEVEDIDAVDNDTEETGDESEGTVEDNEEDIEDDLDVNNTEDDLDIDGTEDGEGMESEEDSEEGMPVEVEADVVDLRGASDEEVISVYKKLKDTDEIDVRKDGDKIHLNDPQSGNEYIIELSDDGPVDNTEEIITDDMNDINESTIYELVLNEYDSHMGYEGANYQHKDVMTNDGVEEPGNGRDIDRGVPRSTSKPYGKPKKQTTPFTQSAKNESVKPANTLNEKTTAPHAAVNNGTPISTPTNSETNRVPRNARKNGKQVKGTAVNPSAPANFVAEATMRKMEKIFEENKALRAQLDKFTKVLEEAAVTNVNLGGIIRLMMENTTTTEEKKNIVERFTNNAHTITESQNLYQTIASELKSKPQPIANINENKQYGVSAENANTINESKFYLDESLSKSLALMHNIC